MTDPAPVSLPDPPYYAVVFTAVPLTGPDAGTDADGDGDGDGTGYRETDERLMKLAADHPGFLGVDSARRADGLVITVSYWKDEASIAAWRNHAEHALARAHGRDHWYASYSLHVAKVERAHAFTRSTTP
ncbi:antibiotic biosynthesis monooxygenase [Streptomyces sp. SP17BM10]|uniref:antibiotic biosynthesis monooxygenase family protein n=1 Tax=Streptomyces sp. SP17BM10 TaxID=3002530 RepID=UPI002E777BD2|nr:antibiotic biosynthesis monooxygenase [Streptomyces sp. SP17BM10]MEE1783458.1 antibiotic biosynthesis monooxygenase [Streptomyces sp. SP17BM10]